MDPGDKLRSASGSTGRGEAGGRLLDSSSWLNKGGLECEALSGGDDEAFSMADGSRLAEMSTSCFGLGCALNGSEIDRWCWRMERGGCVVGADSECVGSVLRPGCSVGP